MATNTSKLSISIEGVRALLEQGRPEAALEMGNHSGQDSPPWQNARAVCLMRLGKAEEAIRVLRAIVFPGGSICPPDDVPALYRANFVSAMLLKHSVETVMPVIEHLKDESHPYVRQLLTAIRCWRKGLTLRERVLWVLGWYPSGRIPFDFQPGGL
ncbi:MAG: hypothetical protein JW993_04915 [Sedimentisphaerales bacterium]|nr:hypothetical protein [Sedimentisphaerales bacterium]